MKKKLYWCTILILIKISKYGNRYLTKRKYLLGKPNNLTYLGHL